MAISLEQQLTNIEKKRKIQNALENEVANTVIEEGRNQVQKTVYDVYPNPKKYDRTGLLKESWSIEPRTNGITIKNTRTDDKTNKYIPPVIETGIGYEYTGYGYSYEKPRPFIQNTKKQIKQDGTHIKALKKGLQQRGVKCE